MERRAFRILRPDGSIRWVSIQGRRHYRDTANGRHAVRSIGTVIDITLLKETEAALRESELRLRLALEAAQMGTFEADVSGGEAIIDVQEAHLLGLPPKTRLVSPEELRMRIPSEDLQASDAKKERLNGIMRPTTTNFVFACRMDRSGGSVLTLPSGRTAFSA